MFVLLSLTLAPPASGQSRTAGDASSRINQTGRVLPLTVPLRDSSRRLGDVLVRIEADDTVRVSISSLLDALSKELAEETVAKLRTVGDFLTLEDLRRSGLDITLDRQAIELVIGFKAAQRQQGEISLGVAAPLGSGTFARPAVYSSYVNLSGQADYVWNTDQTALRFDAAAVARLGSFVLESEFLVQNDVNASRCPSSALCNFGSSGGFKRQGSRMLYDWPKDLNRFTLGDTRTTAGPFQASPDVLGLSFEHAPQKLAPGQSTQSTSSSSFVLERASTVEVLINGVAVQHLRLPPGPYNLRDLPLQSGSNDITLLITDDSGAQRTQKFTTYSSASLLGTGKSEWTITGGVPSYMDSNEIAYRSNHYIASFSGRYGMISWLTAEGQAQVDNTVAMGGGGVLLASPFGVWGLQLAASQSEVGTGGALRLTWDLDRKGDDGALHLAFETHTPEFRTPGQYVTPLNGIVYPTYQYRDSYAASYSRPVFDTWQATATAAYATADPSYYALSPLAARGDRYHLDLGLSHSLSESATFSATLGYSNEAFNRALVGDVAAQLDDTKPSLWAGLRLFWRPGRETVVTASTDSLNQRSYVSGNYQINRGADNWSTTISLADDRRSGSGDVNGSLRYQGQRAEIVVSQDVGTLAYAPNGRNDLAASSERTTVRLGTALVIADGHVAVSSPVRGDGGFAVLYPHPSIAGKEIIAGSSNAPIAKSDMWGPAVVSNLPAYAPQTIPVDVSDLPLGYSLGAGGFDIESPYKGGYALEIGSGYSVSAFGEMQDAYGRPLPLASGIASDGKKSVTVFTNQTGKFAADGLAPGHWTLIMETDEGKAIYALDVPPGTQGLLRLGTLQPGKG